MMPCIAPSATPRLTPESATSPPKRLLSPLTSSSMVARPGPAGCRAGDGAPRSAPPAQRDKPAHHAAAGEPAAETARHVHHREHDDEPENDELVLVVGARPLRSKRNVMGAH